MIKYALFFVASMFVRRVVRAGAILRIHDKDWTHRPIPVKYYGEPLSHTRLKGVTEYRGQNICHRKSHARSLFEGLPKVYLNTKLHIDQIACQGGVLLVVCLSSFSRAVLGRRPSAYLPSIMEG